MEKLKMHTPDKADENFKKLAAMFPNAVTETIGKNLLRQKAVQRNFHKQGQVPRCGQLSAPA